VSGSYDRTIKVWNSTSFQLITILRRHRGSVFSLAIIPSDENIVSGTWDYNIKVLNSTSFETIATFKWVIDEKVSALAIIPSNE
jgi:WD40 repeat protein